MWWSWIWLAAWYLGPLLLIPVAVRSATARAITAIVIVTAYVLYTAVLLDAIEEDATAALGLVMVAPLAVAAVAVAGIADRVVLVRGRGAPDVVWAEPSGIRSPEARRSGAGRSPGPVRADSGDLGLSDVRAEAGFGDRTAALVVDLAVAAAWTWVVAEVVDGTTELAAAGGGAIAVLVAGYLTGGTVGHRLLRLQVVRADGDTGPRRLGVVRATVRAIVIAAEVAGAIVFPPLVLAIVLVELRLVAAGRGQSLADLVVGSRVVGQSG